jgi:hypothetical protein
MSRIALRVASEMLALRILVQEAERALQGIDPLSPNRRKHLAATFHHYLENGGAGHLRTNGISKSHGGVDNPTAEIIRNAASDERALWLRILDTFAEGSVENEEAESLAGFLSRVDAALENGRSRFEAGRYL